MGYDALLLDHDGVLVTLGETSALVEAARDALRDAGVDDPHDEAVDALSVAVDESELRAVSRRYDLDPDRLWRRRDDRVRQALLAETTAGRKAPYDDVAAVADLDTPLGIVSNNQTRIVEFVLDHYDLADHFRTVRARSPTRASLDRKKPRPVYLEEAMADLDADAPLYVGDSESDVIAGHRAGVDTAFVRRSHNAGVDLDAEPTYEVSGLDAVAGLLGGGVPRV